MAVLIETTVGDLIIDLFVKERPRCCMNFLKLCKMKYYNLCQFHMIEQNYVAQTGDPTGTGKGGEAIYALLYGDQAKYFEPELVPKLRHCRVGLISMINNGADMHGSQFFITLGDNLDYLDEKHTIFGQVTEGMETVGILNQQICDDDKRPYKDIRIAHTVILDDPFDDPPRLPFPSRSPSPTVDLLNVPQIALDQVLDENEGKTEEEIKKEIEAKDMAAQAQILEMVGDLHHADEKPPDNVLFVCKLNPVTTDEEKSCEDAYFKMDNVLIDDRRIHVDFSQSVAKNYQWKRKGSVGDVQEQTDQQQRHMGDRRQRQRTERKRGSLTERDEEHTRKYPRRRSKSRSSSSAYRRSSGKYRSHPRRRSRSHSGDSRRRHIHRHQKSYRC